MINATKFIHAIEFGKYIVKEILGCQNNEGDILRKHGGMNGFFLQFRVKIAAH